MNIKFLYILNMQRKILRHIALNALILRKNIVALVEQYDIVHEDLMALLTLGLQRHKLCFHYT